MASAEDGVRVMVAYGNRRIIFRVRRREIVTDEEFSSSDDEEGTGNVSHEPNKAKPESTCAKKFKKEETIKQKTVAPKPEKQSGPGKFGKIFMCARVIPIAVAIAAIFSVFFCRFQECCTDRWTKPNITGLKHAFEKRIFGQHLVTTAAFKAIKGHVMNKSPSKALVLSFNGWTGTGKNFVSKNIAEHLFKKGLDSEFVHQIIATNDFPHESHLQKYKEQLKSWVVGNVTKCAKSMFIFDEMDKMHAGLIDVLKPYLDHYTDVKGVDYRKAIFIFLSNTGGKLINDEALKNWKNGKDRKDITLKQMVEVVNQGAFNMKGGFWYSTLVDKDLIDYFIPFLPMERAQVKLCAKADMEEKGHLVTEKLLNQVADQHQYFPEDTKTFSKSGCRKVSSKVDFVMG